MKYKKLNDYPEELKELIGIMKLLPKNLKKLENVLSELISGFLNEIQIEVEFLTENYRPIESKYIKKVSQVISPKLAKTAEFEKQRGVVNRADLLKTWIKEKQTLLTIINEFRSWKIHSTNNPKYSSIFRFTPIKEVEEFSFNEDGSIGLPKFKVRILDILISNHISVERLKICPHCENIFWRKRISKMRSEGNFCSKRCSDTFGAQLSRLKKRIEILKNEVEKEINKFEKCQESGISNLILEQEKVVTSLKKKLELHIQKQNKMKGNDYISKWN